jgi:hypothetical protein
MDAAAMTIRDQLHLFGNQLADGQKRTIFHDQRIPPDQQVAEQVVVAMTQVLIATKDLNPGLHIGALAAVVGGYLKNHPDSIHDAKERERLYQGFQRALTTVMHATGPYPDEPLWR